MSEPSSSWCVYILRCGDGSLYTGITNRFEQRFAAHVEGRGARYTRGRGPLQLVYQEACAGKSEALRREAAIKKLPAKRKRELLANATNQAIPAER